MELRKKPLLLVQQAARVSNLGIRFDRHRFARCLLRRVPPPRVRCLTLGARTTSLSSRQRVRAVNRLPVSAAQATVDSASAPPSPLASRRTEPGQGRGVRKRTGSTERTIQANSGWNGASPNLLRGSWTPEKAERAALRNLSIVVARRWLPLTPGRGVWDLRRVDRT